MYVIININEKFFGGFFGWQSEAKWSKQNPYVYYTLEEAREVVADFQKRGIYGTIRELKLEDLK